MFVATDHRVSSLFVVLCSNSPPACPRCDSHVIEVTINIQDLKEKIVSKCAAAKNHAVNARAMWQLCFLHVFMSLHIPLLFPRQLERNTNAYIHTRKGGGSQRGRKSLNICRLARPCACGRMQSRRPIHRKVRVCDCEGEGGRRQKEGKSLQRR